MKEVKVKVSRKKRRPIISGVILLCIGLFMLGQTSDLIPSFDRTWPIFLIIIGVAWIVGALFKRDEHATPHPDQPTD